MYTFKVIAFASGIERRSQQGYSNRPGGNNSATDLFGSLESWFDISAPRTVFRLHKVCPGHASFRAPRSRTGSLGGMRFHWSALLDISWYKLEAIGIAYQLPRDVHDLVRVADEMTDGIPNGS